MLRMMRGHTGCVGAPSHRARSLAPTRACHRAAPRSIRSVRFARDNTHVLSASDDRTVRVWDIGTGKCECTLRGHSDYVRGVALAPATQPWATFATSSFDHTVRLWDARAGGGGGGSCTMSLDHGAPVEQALWLPSGSLLLSAGGSEVKVWDVLAGGRLVHSFSSHLKSVMALLLDGTGTRLLSAGLDQHLKIHDLATYEVAHSIKYSVPILSAAAAVRGGEGGQVACRWRR